MKKFIILSCALFLLQACSIKQSISKLPESSMEKMDEICIIENPKVKKSFLPVYTDALKKNGISTKTLAPSSNTADCDFTSTYTALWSWDLVIYMSYAELNIYEKGGLAGNAVYDSRSGSANMGKFIDVDNKVNELVDGMLGEKRNVEKQQTNITRK